MGHEPLRHEQLYHIYSRGNNRESIFREERNYQYFLRLYAHHIDPIAETLAFCLLPNHFHVLVRTRPVQRSHQAFSNLLNAYARGFNQAYDRRDALFQRPFRRIAVMDERYLRRLIPYIHQNPQRHGLVDDFSDWPYSSYHALGSTGVTRLGRDEVHEQFGSLEAFLLAHQTPIVLE